MLKDVYPIRRIKQILSLHIFEKQTCTLLYGNSWEVVFDSLLISLNEPNSPMEYSLYPNPFSSYLEVSGKSEGRMEFFSINGNLLFERNLQYGTNHFDMPDLPTGVYFVKVSSKEHSKFYKLIKDH